MAETYSQNLQIDLPYFNDYPNAWGPVVNTSLGTLLEQAITGFVQQPFSISASNQTITLPITAGADQGGAPTGQGYIYGSPAPGTATPAYPAAYSAPVSSRNMYILCTGGGSTTGNTLVLQPIPKLYYVWNGTSNTISVKVVGGSNVITVSANDSVPLVCNGSDLYPAFSFVPYLHIASTGSGSGLAISQNGTGYGMLISGNQGEASAVALQVNQPINNYAAVFVGATSGTASTVYITQATSQAGQGLVVAGATGNGQVLARVNCNGPTVGLWVTNTQSNPGSGNCLQLSNNTGSANVSALRIDDCAYLSGTTPIPGGFNPNLPVGVTAISGSGWVLMNVGGTQILVPFVIPSAGSPTTVWK
jgi:hypothetical protein